VSFIIGFSFIILLAIFTIVLWLISKRLPQEFILSTVVFMMVGDGVLVGLWYYGLLEIVESIKQFRLGIAGAFCVSAMGRSIYFLLQNEKV
jgi:hypothetical protein